MAKKDKKDKKAKKAEQKARAQFMGAAIEAKGFDVAHKIWLAGVGAYGKAYDVAAEGVGKVSGQGEVLFDDLVARGEEIESDVRARLTSNTAISRMTEQMNRVAEEAAKVRGRVAEATGEATEAVTKFQAEQRERLEARMERMREALGLGAPWYVQYYKWLIQFFIIEPMIFIDYLTNKAALLGCGPIPAFIVANCG